MQASAARGAFYAHPNRPQGFSIPKNYVFEGKTSLIDVYKILEITGDEFEALKGESDTIAGFCIEQAGKILLKNEKINFKNYTLTVVAADKRKIKQIKITINEDI